MFVLQGGVREYIQQESTAKLETDAPHVVGGNCLNKKVGAVLFLEKGRNALVTTIDSLR